ncbi:zinc finger protein [Macleaya cordata]|uniref:Protein FAR1-RELATED SEQUENCE n=1 Tax=Macleaya cordata TaxID=56857 RepID=A0A200PS54_MACCD|nr:zinc finger protein [Macleaya cordata]
MEKQAADLYTRKLFMKFQEELVETLTFMATKMDDDGAITTFRVAKFGEDHKAYFVRLNVLEMRATCSCQMFEFSGLLCRHILTVFRVTNVLTLPSHYVLKRWTRNAKSGVVLEERASDLLISCRESATVRYNNLRHEALKYVDEGAKTMDIYTVAMECLQEAAKTVALAKKNGGRLPIVNGSSSVTDGSFSSGALQWGSGEPQSADEKDKKIQELYRELNRANRKCEVYRANLLTVLKDIEEQKLQLSVVLSGVGIPFLSIFDDMDVSVILIKGNL